MRKRKRRDKMLENGHRGIFKGRSMGTSVRVPEGLGSMLSEKGSKSHMPLRNGDGLQIDMKRAKYLESIPTSLFRGGANTNFGKPPAVQSEFLYETPENASLHHGPMVISSARHRRISELALSRVNYAPQLKKWLTRRSPLQTQDILVQGAPWKTSEMSGVDPGEEYDDGGTYGPRRQLGMYGRASASASRNRGLMRRHARANVAPQDQGYQMTKADRELLWGSTAEGIWKYGKEWLSQMPDRQGAGNILRTGYALYQMGLGSGVNSFLSSPNFVGGLAEAAKTFGGPLGRGVLQLAADTSPGIITLAVGGAIVKTWQMWGPDVMLPKQQYEYSNELTYRLRKGEKEGLFKNTEEKLKGGAFKIRSLTSEELDYLTKGEDDSYVSWFRAMHQNKYTRDGGQWGGDGSFIASPESAVMYGMGDASMKANYKLHSDRAKREAWKLEKRERELVKQIGELAEGNPKRKAMTAESLYVQQRKARIYADFADGDWRAARDRRHVARKKPRGPEEKTTIFEEEGDIVFNDDTSARGPDAPLDSWTEWDSDTTQAVNEWDSEEPYTWRDSAHATVWGLQRTRDDVVGAIGGAWTVTWDTLGDFVFGASTQIMDSADDTYGEGWSAPSWDASEIKQNDVEAHVSGPHMLPVNGNEHGQEVLSAQHARVARDAADLRGERPSNPAETRGEMRSPPIGMSDSADGDRINAQSRKRDTNKGFEEHAADPVIGTPQASAEVQMHDLMTPKSYDERKRAEMMSPTLRAQMYYDASQQLDFSWDVYEGYGCSVETSRRISLWEKETFTNMHESFASLERILSRDPDASLSLDLRRMMATTQNALSMHTAGSWKMLNWDLLMAKTGPLPEWRQFQIDQFCRIMEEKANPNQAKQAGRVFRKLVETNRMLPETHIFSLYSAMEWISSSA
jgi:hypothetical protein